MYYLVFGLLYLLSLLPFFVLYLISDLIFVILYYLIRYRRKIILTNLQIAFPEKNEAELDRISRRFYRNFTDNWIETIKLLSISKSALSKRLSGNFDVFYALHKKNKSVQVNLAHFFNWEIMTLYTGIMQPYPFLTVYYQQRDNITNRLIVHLRSRWGNPQLPVNSIKKEILAWRGKQYLMALGADQSPPNCEDAYWLYFLNRPTAFLKGPEKLARMQNLSVVMMTTSRPKRGHYHFEYVLVAEDPKDLPEGELMRRYIKHVEANIHLQPELYLWSHRRWKQAWKKKYEALWKDNAPMPQTNEVES